MFWSITESFLNAEQSVFEIINTQAMPTLSDPAVANAEKRIKNMEVDV